MPYMCFLFHSALGFLRNCILVGLSAANRKPMVASFWPLLYACVLRWDATSKPYFKTCAMEVFLGQFSSLTFSKNFPNQYIASFALKQFISFICWAKVTSCCGNNISDDYTKLDTSKIFQLAFGSPVTSQIREFWLSALSSESLKHSQMVVKKYQRCVYIHTCVCSHICV